MRITDSADIVRDRHVKVKPLLLLPGIDISLKGDDRLEAIVKELQQHIKDHNWKLPKDEKQITVDMLHLIHKDKYYGKYDPEQERFAKEIEKNKDELNALNNEFNPAEIKKIKEGFKQDDMSHLRQDSDKEYVERGKDLKDFKANKSVCLEFGIVASYVGERVGIHNDFCTGLQNQDPDSAHAFLQSRLTGNIIEATNINGYFENKNNAKIKDGKIVIAENEKGHTVSYGTGQIGLFQNLRLRITHNGDHIVREMEENIGRAGEAYEKSGGKIHNPKVEPQKAAKAEMLDPFDAKKGLKVDDLSATVALTLNHVDSNKDGQLYAAELKAFAKSMHIDSQKIKPTSHIDIKESIAKMRQELRLADKDHDGYISPKELKDSKVMKNLGKIFSLD